MSSAVATLGRARVRKGPVRLGSTRWVSPTKRGFKVFDALLLQLQRAHGTGEVASYTVNLKVRFRGPDGRFVKPVELEGVGLPRLRDVARRRRKGETMAEAFRRIVELEVRKAMYRAVENQAGIGRGGYKDMAAKVKGRSAEQVRKALTEFKRRRGLAFRTTVNRVLS